MYIHILQGKENFLFVYIHKVKFVSIYSFTINQGKITFCIYIIHSDSLETPVDINICMCLYLHFFYN